MIPGYFKLLALGALIAALIGWGWVGGKASERRAWQLKEAAQVAAQLAASEKARIVERELQQRVDDANAALQVEKTKHARIAAALKRDADGLRESIAKFASGPSGDPQCAATGRAVALGELLDAALQAAIGCAIRGENDAAIARGLYSSWPVGGK